MKILLVAQSMKQNDGWSTYAYTTATALQQRGHDVCVLVEQEVDVPIKQITGLPAPLPMMSRPDAWIRTVRALRKAISEYKPDLIHILVEPYAVAMPLLRMTGKKTPWAMNLHGTYSALPFRMWQVKWLMCKAVKQARAFLVCSQYTMNKSMEAAAAGCGSACATSMRDRSTFFRFGIYPPQQQKKHHDPDTRHILFVGGVKARKGVMELVRGFHAYQESAAPCHLHLVGTADENNPYVQEVRAYLEAWNLQNHVTLHGHVSEEQLESLYAQADVFAMLSKSNNHDFEGYGLVLIEANARGIPVLCSQDSGCKEAVDEGRSGFSVDHDNPDAIAEKLQLILDDQAIQEADCFAWAQAHSVDQQMDTFEQFYQKALTSQA